ncbi:hypothetical protein ABOM_003244 [Aspergillus bombycis]|uniref:Protein kinase domain-containing protein n=1 Tax=Aspergillus bombycis TaxID=109264 RepID=A0A1F8A7Y1_9EURO|nr:hypothetical protein ABOM_003244 [Aspergillus bombycis]OGM47824.1 hypothetical protein ABOM_003244 [Aspergillus bombycis]
MAFENVDALEIMFKQQLCSSDYSVVFLVLLRSQTCIMKVRHGPGVLDGFTNRRVVSWISTYLSLQHIIDLRSKGYAIVELWPQFLGTLEKFDPRQCQPFRKAFIEDQSLPSAIFLAYIPNLDMPNLQNCTEKRLEALVRGVREIHEASVRHRDPKPRNIMVINDDPDRVVWVDVDRAETYNKKQLTDRQKDFLDEEEIMVREFRNGLVSPLMPFIFRPVEVFAQYIFVSVMRH